MWKKSTLAVLGLSVSSFAVAGTMGPVCTPGNVTVPCEIKRWDFGIQALYLTAVSNKPYVLSNVNVIGEAPAGFSSSDPGWNTGYRLEGSYHFNTGNDLTLDWTHYSNMNSPSNMYFGAIPLAPLFGPFMVIDNNRFDQVNLVMGQHADFSIVDNVRLYGGLQYAYIQYNINNFYPYTAPPLINSINLTNNSDFKGVGPVLGIDYSYNVTNSLSITANGSGSILYGTTRYSNGYVLNPNGVVVSSIYASRKTVVPSLEGKLGLNYAYALQQGVFNIEGGYQVINYFSALQSQSWQLITNPIVSSDYGLHGPYLGIKYVGNA